MYMFLFAIQKGGVVYNRETDSFDVIPGENVKMVRPSKQTHEELQRLEGTLAGLKNASPSTTSPPPLKYFFSLCIICVKYTKKPFFIHLVQMMIEPFIIYHCVLFFQFKVLFLMKYFSHFLAIMCSIFIICNLSSVQLSL